MQWSHSASLLERLTNDLDKESNAGAEAKELLEFVQEEWMRLRNQLEASGIGVKDEERRQCEAAVGEAVEEHSNSRWEECLKALGNADGLMEKLRRRV